MDIGKRDGHNFIEHSGEVSGFVSENIVFPDDHAAIVVLTNEMATNAASLIARRITPTVLDLPAAAPTKDEAQALAIFNGLADGHIDRTLFTKYCNAYFNQQTLDDFASSLKPLGPPLTFKQTTQEARGGMLFRVFHRHLSRPRPEGDDLPNARRKVRTVPGNPLSSHAKDAEARTEL